MTGTVDQLAEQPTYTTRVAPSEASPLHTTLPVTLKATSVASSGSSSREDRDFRPSLTTHWIDHFFHKEHLTRTVASHEDRDYSQLLHVSLLEVYPSSTTGNNIWDPVAGRAASPAVQASMVQPTHL